MATLAQQQSRERYMKKEMHEIFASLEFKIFEHLKAADHLLSRISAEASAVNVPYYYSQEYNRVKVLDRIDQIAELREEEDGRSNTKKARGC